MERKRGRGIWRWLYDPNSSLFVTVGFDSAIKLHKVPASLPWSLREKDEDTLYVSTNHGYLYHAKFSPTWDVKWTKLVRVGEEVPIICMDLLSKTCPNIPLVLMVVDFTFAWSFGKERQPEFTSCFGIQIMCLDALFEDEILICGDLRGNLVLFPLPKDLLLCTPHLPALKISQLSYFKGAHGISSVSSISVAKSSFDEIEICTTGSDGCICYFEYDAVQQSLEFIGMKQVKELSLVRSVSAVKDSPDEKANCGYAVGFASTDFIIWNLITETKVVRIPCGGWRRPHCYYLGEVPEMKNCFAYVKDEIIYVYQNWVPKREGKIFPLNLHIQFHGREMHSLCFVSESLFLEEDGKHGSVHKTSWIATGCEDGTKVNFSKIQLPIIEKKMSSFYIAEKAATM
ncbi:hypothetical protein K2173_001776 [Erythroxylum novogranatense]|uniref:Uncharacterized protein n=1 Tax=Erythroxylum novogranatense TaxID=1862640 RepID=A0AAV8SJD9_9ROSI|nr:hypothetical protein K2173_001776 [Erythroxylum novogranatense]